MCGCVSRHAGDALDPMTLQTSLHIVKLRISLYTLKFSITAESCCSWAEQVTAYFPPGVWYSLWDGTSVDAGDGGTTRTLPALLGDVPVHARGGSIVPVQRPALVTRDVRTSPLRFLVHLPSRVSRNRDTRPMQSPPESAP